MKKKLRHRFVVFPEQDISTMRAELLCDELNLRFELLRTAYQSGTAQVKEEDLALIDGNGTLLFLVCVVYGIDARPRELLEIDASYIATLAAINENKEHVATGLTQKNLQDMLRQIRTLCKAHGLILYKKKHG